MLIIIIFFYSGPSQPMMGGVVRLVQKSGTNICFHCRELKRCCLPHHLKSKIFFNFILFRYFKFKDFDAMGRQILFDAADSHAQKIFMHYRCPPSHLKNVVRLLPLVKIDQALSLRRFIRK